MSYWSEGCSLIIPAAKRQYARAILELLDEYTMNEEHGNYTLVDKKNADEPYFRKVLEYIGFDDGVIDADGDYQLGRVLDGPYLLSDYLRVLAPYLEGKIYLYDEDDNDRWGYSFEDEQMKYLAAEITYKEISNPVIPFPHDMRDFFFPEEEEEEVEV